MKTEDMIFIFGIFLASISYIPKLDNTLAWTQFVFGLLVIGIGFVFKLAEELK